MKKILIVLGLMLLPVFGVMSQDAPQKYSESDYQTVYEFFDAIKAREMMQKTFVQILDRKVDEQSISEIRRKELGKIEEKYFSFDALKKELASIYLNNFTPDELKEATKFYKSPLGQKLLAKTPALSNGFVELANRKIAKCQDELRKMNEMK